MEQWTTAFLRCVAVYTTKHRYVTPQLMKHGESVRDLLVPALLILLLLLLLNQAQTCP